MTTPQNFQVDLAGMVQLLSRNLYSGPRVFVRELLQNAVDAITARREIEPDCPATIAIDLLASAGNISGQPDLLRVTDSGKGLTVDEAGSLLATIGASSKRDEFGFQRKDYLGQFGIGLLSALMVSSSIVVYSRSVETLDKPVRWEGHANGTWTTRIATQDEVPSSLRGAGTVVELRRTDFDFSRVPDLVSYYGRFLPAEITINGEPQGHQPPPWELAETEQKQWCQTNFGFKPFDCIPLRDEISGARGVAYVLSAGAHPGQHLKHTVFLHRMLLSDTVGDLVPDWAYFVRVVVDVENLSPTASREDLAEDDLLEETRERFGESIRTWLTTLADRDPQRFMEFLGMHLTGLKTLALIDEPTRHLVVSTAPIPTSLGFMTFEEIMNKYGAITYTRTTNAFDAVASIAAAQEMCVVNAGYAFDEEIINQLMLDYPHIPMMELNPTSLLDSLAEPDEGSAQQLADLLQACKAALTGQDVEIVLRSYAPATSPSLYLHDPDSAGRRIEKEANDLDSELSTVLGLLNPHSLSTDRDARPRLVLNVDNVVLHQLAAALSARPNDTTIVTAALRGLYIQALVSARQTLDTQASGWSSSLFTTLIAQSLNP